MLRSGYVLEACTVQSRSMEAAHREKRGMSRPTDEELVAIVAARWPSLERSEAQIAAGDLGKPMATSGFRDLAGHVDARTVLAATLMDLDGYGPGQAEQEADAMLAALAAAGLAVVPDGQVQLGGQRLEIIASDYGTLDRIAKLANAAGSITVRMLPVAGTK